MSDNKISVVPEAIEPLSNAISKNLPETAKQTDGALSTIVGFFNNVVLYPVKAANINFKYKLENFERDIEVKYKKIPPERRQEPPITIAGPTLEALKYTYDEKELREMFVNLLSSSMDSESAAKTHPSYVEIIRQLGTTEAQILKSFIVPVDSFPISEVHFKYANRAGNIIGVMPKLFAPSFCRFGDPFVVSVAFENLSRLGIVSISYTKWFKGDIYESYKTDPFVLEKFNQLKGSENNISISVTRGICTITDFGRRFIEVCVDKEEPVNAN